MSSPHSTLRLTARPEDIRTAGAILQGGGLVAIPTETVYGLAADGLNRTAVQKIFAAKGRPHWDPLILHVSDMAMLHRVVADVTPVAQALMKAFWPGPLTLLLPRGPAVPDAVTAGRPLVAVRMPAHPVALAILHAANTPLAAPSANRFGHISPTSATHVFADLDGRIDAVVDAGSSDIGVESTVLDPFGPVLTIYRQGGVSLLEIEHVTGLPVHLYAPPAAGERPESLPSPGVGIRHYAPRARVHLVHSEAELLASVSSSNSQTTAVLLPADWHLDGFGGTVVSWADWADSPGLARTLYSSLRALDGPDIQSILVPLPAEPVRSGGSLRGAIRDRLLKAAQQR